MRSGKKIFSFFLGIALITISFVKTNTASASSPIELPLGTTVSGYITDTDDEQIYMINLKQAGRVTVKLDSYIAGVYIGLEDSDGNEVFRKYVSEGNPVNPAKWSDWKDLEAGTYYIKVNKSSSTGKYDLRVNYEAANNNEIGPNNGTVQAQPLALNSQTVTGFISWNDSNDYYKVVLPKSGRVTVKLDSFIAGVYIGLEDSEGNEVFSKYVSEGNPANPAKWSDWKDLEAGTYYIKVNKSSSTGKYDLKVNYEAAKNNEIEPNNGTVQAQPLAVNSQTVTGFISWNDSNDYYKVVLPKSGRVTVKLDSFIAGVYIGLEDSEGNEVFSKYVSEGNPANPAKWSEWKDLKAGTYYIKVNKSTSTGKYTLSVQSPDLLPAPPTVNLVSNKSKSVTGKTVPNGTVSVKINSKVYTGKSDSKGAFNVSIPVQKAGTKLYVTVKDKSGYTSKERAVVVADRIPPAAPSVNTITSKSKTITGKAEANSTVIAYVGSQKIGSAKADKYGKYTIKITPKKTGTSIKVIAVDGSGNKSAGKVVKVKK
ncbi:hypothetical protein C0966_12710 [Bacillus methanolicus]|uniref:Ig-like domain-containing protein n=1 Tax=Bacillus methanolicus TaxID=1471 RepID=UPI00238055C8|nr:Ig-like domain-containing protein [Bacillus methanolicus]MDE3840208.1 hypothetical protein [Bacillus methanolicus]